MKIVIAPDSYKECLSSREVAAAERNPIIASSKGVGELIMEAFWKGCRRLVIGLGGSATCDGGTGMLSVPGVKDALRETTVELLCDVDNPFIGPEGAARVFAPQKGASPTDVEMLEARMAELARGIAAETGVDVSSVPGAGAAGGLVGALIAYADAELRSGVDAVMRYTHFDAEVVDADLVFTGEGRSDFQTLKGKVPYGVLQHCRGKREALLSGAVETNAVGALYDAGFWTVWAVTPRGMHPDIALDPDVAKQNIFSAVIRTLS